PGAGGQNSLYRLLELFRLAPDEVAGGFGAAWLGSVRRSSSVLLARGPRLRVGANAAGARPTGGGRRLEPPGLGTADRQDPPRPTVARKQPPAEQAGAGHRPAGSR